MRNFIKRLQFSCKAEWDFVNGLPVPCISGLGLLPVMIVGMVTMRIFNIVPDNPILAGFASLLLGPLALVAGFFGMTFILSTLPKKLIAPWCRQTAD